METRTSELVRSQLEKIVSSPGFVRSDRLGGFLRFVIEQELAGKGDQLKESIIGVEVFGRKPDYDVRVDSVVRTEAARLRSRLAEYYAAEGAAASVIIELPKGGYKPLFRAPSGSGAGPLTRAEPPGSALAVRLWPALTLAALAVAAGLGWWRFHPQNAPIPIAVLPLINLSQDSANDYFADGLTSEIIRNLSNIEGLAVRSQSSSFAFKGKPQKAGDAGRQL